MSIELHIPVTAKGFKPAIFTVLCTPRSLGDIRKPSALELFNNLRNRSGFRINRIGTRVTAKRTIPCSLALIKVERDHRDFFPLNIFPNILFSPVKKRMNAHMRSRSKIGFDMTEASPKLTYKPVGFLDEAQWNKVKEVAQSDVVRRILGASVTEVHEAEAASVPAEQTAEKKTEAVITKAKTVTKAEVAAAVETPKVVKEEPKPEPVKTPPVVDAGDDDELDLSGLSFDD